MGLTCGCWDDIEPGMKMAYGPDKYAPLTAYRRQRCMSCKELIDVGSIAAKVTRYKVPESGIEIKIYGYDGEIPIAPKWLCERCADLYFSLEELGYCVNPHDDMRELAKDYAEAHQK